MRRIRTGNSASGLTRAIFDGCSPGGKHPLMPAFDAGWAGYRPWFLTASTASAAASGSRYRPPLVTGLNSSSSW